jgi:ABC-type Zn uptake system ZnuABC Zn-binding protein ZnuA
VSNWLQGGKMYQNNAAKFSTFAEENDKKAIFLKNETTKTLLKTAKTSILESQKNTAPRAKPVCSGCA